MQITWDILDKSYMGAYKLKKVFINGPVKAMSFYRWMIKNVVVECFT